MTHDEALWILDEFVRLSVLDRDLTASPGSPAAGRRHFVAGGGTAYWLGCDPSVVLLTDGSMGHAPFHPGGPSLNRPWNKGRTVRSLKQC